MVPNSTSQEEEGESIFGKSVMSEKDGTVLHSFKYDITENEESFRQSLTNLCPGVESGPQTCSVGLLRGLLFFFFSQLVAKLRVSIIKIRISGFS